MRRNWEDLANAVILQAVEDYRQARRRVKKHPDQKAARGMLRETKRFIRSRWFAQLTDISGEQLMEKLKKEAA
jgi:hypothetical protein